MVLGYFFMYVWGMCSHIAAFRILYGIRVKLSDHIGSLPLGYFNKNALSLATFVLPVGLLLISRDPNNMAFAATLIFFLVLAPGISTPIFKLSSFASTLSVIVEGVKRMDEIGKEKTIEEPKSGNPPSSHDIGFSEVSFWYGGEGGIEVLKGINFTALQGKITALVGPSGSGKSTIAQLIPRFWDVQKGSITIGGVDIRDMRTHELMDTMSFVFQDTFLFSDTLYNNILAGRPTATKEEVYAAARAAQCHEFIERLPKAYDTLIGEGGVSDGCLRSVARAFRILSRSCSECLCRSFTCYCERDLSCVV
ncbi:ABC transporter ATP-binding protein [Paenibacillus profundus]|uniref:ABC transporter ATP-binding protein n=1 Tax=Paenibacillus profundus TaxID=1173085 RepID=A0ABS8YFH7_9BACL|nr:ABC transporter ATP-binding protein [Paenibacillus profundus]MCE5170743.1 ABC transporter ATP-binding protein [Paenibacillus profundus]